MAYDIVGESCPIHLPFGEIIQILYEPKQNPDSIGPHCLEDEDDLDKTETDIMIEIEATLIKGIERIKQAEVFDDDCGPRPFDKDKKRS
jgi:hypothetical protein